MEFTTTTTTLTKTKQTKPQRGSASKAMCSKHAATSTAATSTAPSMIPNVPMMTTATTLIPVMITKTECDMKMLEELYASACGEDRCSSFVLGERQDRVVNIDGSVVTIRFMQTQ